ncbi:hypothetical protein BaRGS_00027152 [Batillaria attramentaria]|uniref:Leucine-rich repeat-containing protein 61 n=1 Tax=Batillaria attramentaria TaxID=370345 RepID=A0ABD0K463_9CAEN
MTVEDGKITKSFLKITSGEFDLESIHTLMLHEAGISDLGCISECTSLERVDLSKNDITKLHKLAGLASVQSLNLSTNRISSLDGLQSLENLRSLNLAGNLIGSVDCLQCLRNLEHLKELRLKNDAQGLSNPACMHPSYAKDVIRMLPSLLILDGQRVRGQGSELFYICQEMDKELESFSEDRDIDIPLVSIERQPSDFWRLPNSARSSGVQGVNKAEEQLKDLLTSCQHLSERAAERLRELQEESKPALHKNIEESEPVLQVGSCEGSELHAD